MSLIAEPASIAQTSAVEKDQELVITRMLSAPRELVWKVYTQPEHVIHWWGPNGFTHTFHEFEFAEGGVWRFMMHGPDGTDYPNRVIFREIKPIERIVYDHDSDDDNNVDVRFSVVTTMEDRGNQTFLTHHMRATSAVMLERMKSFGAIEGAKQHLARLDAYLQGLE